MKSTFRFAACLVALLCTTACADWTSAYTGNPAAGQRTAATGLNHLPYGAGAAGAGSVYGGVAPETAATPGYGMNLGTNNPLGNAMAMQQNIMTQPGMAPQSGMPYGAIQTSASSPVAQTAPMAGVGGCSTGCAAPMAPPMMTAPMMASMAPPMMPRPGQIPMELAARRPFAARQAVRNSPAWFGGLYGLVMNRDDNNNIYFLNDPSVNDRSYLATSEADMEFAGGYEVRLGHTFASGNYGLEFVYWELFPNEAEAITTLASVPAPSLYNTISYTDVYMPSGATVDALYGGGAIQAARLRRDWDFQNIEVNIISRPLYAGGGFRAGRPRSFGPGFASGFGGGGTFGGPGAYGPSVANCSSGACGDGCGDGSCGDGCGCGQPYYDGSGYFPAGNGVGGPVAGCGGDCPPRLHIGWGFGARYFKFDEDFALSYDNTNSTFDEGIADQEFYHDINVDNDLVGFQMLLNTDYYLSRRLHLEAGTKFGFYANHFSSNQRVFDAGGNAYLDPGGPGVEAVVNVDDEDIAFLGEVRFGLGYKIGCHWRLTGGYRALAASGIALSSNQIPFGESWTNRAGYQDINRNGDLILHGAYGGLEFAW